MESKTCNICMSLCALVKVQEYIALFIMSIFSQLTIFYPWEEN